MKTRHQTFLYIIGAVVLIASFACSLTPRSQTPTQVEKEATQAESEPPSDSIISTLPPSDLIPQEIPTLEIISLLEPIQIDLQSAITLQGVSRPYTVEEQIANQEFVFVPSIDLEVEEDVPALPANTMINPVVGGCNPVRFLADILDANGNSVFPFFVYGTFPLFLVRYVAGWTGMNGYNEVHIVGRYLSGVLDLSLIHI